MNGQPEVQSTRSAVACQVVPVAHGVADDAKHLTCLCSAAGGRRVSGLQSKVQRFLAFCP